MDVIADGATLTCVAAPPCAQTAAHIAASLAAAYNALLAEHERRLAERERIRASVLSVLPTCEGMVDVGAPSSFDHEELAARIVRGLLSEQGRTALGLHPQVSIPYSELEARYVHPLARIGSGREYWRGRYRGSEEDGDVAAAPAVRMDIAGLVQHLRALYAGSAGAATYHRQLANDVFKSLGLQSAEFAPKGGKVDLTVHVYGYRTGPEPYGSDTERDMMRLVEVVALAEGVDEAERSQRREEFERLRGKVRPGMRISLGDGALLRTFQSHYRVVLTEQAADQLRAFIAEHRTTEEEAR